MKIFWSWQSDTHRPSGQYFVRDLLREVVKGLSSVEAAEAAERDDEEHPEETGSDADELLPEDGRIHVDHDTFGVSGSPRIADKILEKIREAAVFVADITPIATTKGGKRVPNPNVMLELGYALKVMDVERIILIGNQRFGAALDHMPFDLKAWRKPIFYKLGEESNAEQRDQVATKLAAELRHALMLALNTAEKQMREAKRRTERAPELWVRFQDEDAEPRRISQTPRSLAADTLEEIRSKTPLLPIPALTAVPRIPGISLPHVGSQILAGLHAKSLDTNNRAEVEAHNALIEAYYADYERYLDRQTDYSRSIMRSFQVNLCLENSGTAPATGIDVEIEFPPGITLLGEDDDMPKGPTAPSPPPTRTKQSWADLGMRDAFIAPTLTSPLRYLPKTTRVDAKARTVSFTLSDLKHHHLANFLCFWLFFDTEDDIASFEAPYVITANEPLEPIRGTLIFPIERLT